MSLVLMRRQMKYLQYVVWGFVIIFVLGAVLQFNQSSGPGAGGASGVFARVDGKEISTEQFARNLSMMREQYRSFASYGQAASLQQYAELPRYAWEQLLEEYAQAAAAEKHGVSVSISEADKALRDQVEERLKTVGVGATPQELAQYREMLMAGRDVEAQRRQMLAERLRDKLSKEVSPVEVKVAHVLVKADTRTDEAARKLALDIAKQAKAGADFAKLANQHSEDAGSKVKGGEVGWASAMPPSAPTGKDAKPDPNAATSFVPEFTAAALMLKPGQVSDPVKSTFGYHVLKALEVRDYKPKLDDVSSAPVVTPGAKPGDKPAEKTEAQKRQEAVDQYKTAMANQIAQGLFSEQKALLESKVTPEAPWLKGYVAEQVANKAPMTLDKSGKPAQTEAQKLAPAIAAYEEALKGSGPEVGPPLAYKLGQLYQRAERFADANTLLEKWGKKSGNAEMYVLHAEVLEKLKKKTEAIAAYQSAVEAAFKNPELLNRVADKFKELGRNDLAQSTRAKSAKQVAQQAEERDRQQKQQEAAMKEAAAKDAAEKAAAAAKAAPADAGQEITVKTGPIDPKTGKPTILSVTPGGKDAKDAKPDAKDAAPAKP